MNRFNRWAVIAAALLLAAGVFAVAYNGGVAHGFEQGGQAIAQAPGTLGSRRGARVRRPPAHGTARPLG